MHYFGICNFCAKPGNLPLYLRHNAICNSDDMQESLDTGLAAVQTGHSFFMLAGDTWQMCNHVQAITSNAAMSH